MDDYEEIIKEKLLRSTTRTLIDMIYNVFDYFEKTKDESTLRKKFFFVMIKFLY
jgi:hypothetical protein